MKKVSLIFLVIVLLIFISCTKWESGSGPTGYPRVSEKISLPEKIMENINYGNHPLQYMDILLPYGRNIHDTKMMMLIHGGQWSSGEKQYMDGYMTALRSKLPGYAFVNINYRLVNGTDIQLPLQELDVKAALEYLWSRTDSFNISKKTVLLGEGAGGNLALLNGYKNFSSNIKVVIAVSAPTDLVEMYNSTINPQVKPTLELATGGTPATHLQVYYDSSPINFVNTNDPATLLFHGADNAFVSPQQSIKLESLINNTNMIYQLVLFPGEAQAFSQSTLIKMFDQIATFLSDNHLFR